ncbi:PREDICTED: uncharacterized protein LOC109167503 [Ipomoea nil]|uniref:uncharacterized protein LOC109167503 n=1 Tax=Ipomoea nil TaxID=35883 RepID=UPI0009016702|nr:PREDICTED: uncharacterized protein LOC109167503 [Ipomoea nil]
MSEHDPSSSIPTEVPIPPLEEAYAALDINADDESDGLDLGFEEDVDPITDFSLTLVGRLMTDKIVKFAFMRDTMAAVWRPRMGVAAKELINNTYLFQFFHDIDMQRVLEDGPWSFEQNLLALAKVQPDIPPIVTPLDTANFWVQLHDLPLGFFSEKTFAAIGNFIGEFIRIDDGAFSGWFKTFVRIRVRINITKPLISQMRIKRNGGDWSWISFRTHGEILYQTVRRISPNGRQTIWTMVASTKPSTVAGRRE